MRTQATRHSDCTAHLHGLEAFLPSRRARRSCGSARRRPRRAAGRTPGRGGRRLPGRRARRRAAPRRPAAWRRRRGRRGSRARQSPSRARRVRRTAADLLSMGAPSSTTSAKAPLRSRMSAHQAARVASCGRIIHTPCVVAQVHPVARVEGPLGVDVGDPAVVGHRGLDEGAGEGGLAAARAAHDLGEPAARQPSARQRRVERRDPGGKRGRRGRRWRKELNELGEREGHACSGSRYGAGTEQIPKMPGVA